MMRALHRPEPVAVDTTWIPHRHARQPNDRYLSTRQQKPWGYDVAVSMPHYESVDTLPVVLSLLRAQSVRPFIQIVDTGSTPETCAALEELRADDLEIHYLRFNAVRHLSDLPALACDLAFSSCRSDKVVLMHTDVFLRAKDALEQLMLLCGAKHPAVGFQMTPRDYPGWEKAITHSLACFDIETMDRIGAAWNLRAACRKMACEHSTSSRFGNLIDTEIGLAVILEQAGIEPLFVGTEENFEQTIHPLMRHCRTLTGGRLYSPSHAAKAQGWLTEAILEAQSNLQAWKEPNV